MSDYISSKHNFIYLSFGFMFNYLLKKKNSTALTRSSKAGGNQKAEELLQQILDNAEVRQQVSRELDLAKQQATKKEE